MSPLSTKHHWETAAADMAFAQRSVRWSTVLCDGSEHSWLLGKSLVTIFGKDIASRDFQIIFDQFRIALSHHKSTQLFTQFHSGLGYCLSLTSEEPGSPLKPTWNCLSWGRYSSFLNKEICPCLWLSVRHSVIQNQKVTKGGHHFQSTMYTTADMAGFLLISQRVPCHILPSSTIPEYFMCQETHRVIHAQAANLPSWSWPQQGAIWSTWLSGVHMLRVREQLRWFGSIPVRVHLSF